MMYWDDNSEVCNVSGWGDVSKSRQSTGDAQEKYEISQRLIAW